jgi:hypothetical protein
MADLTTNMEAQADLVVELVVKPVVNLGALEDLMISMVALEALEGLVAPEAMMTTTTRCLE